jgi:hypothetical protein
MFCAPGLVFDGAECVGSRFYVLRARNRFRRHRGRRVPFSCFALPNSFLTVPTASCPFFMFCAPGLLFGGTEGIGSHFHVLRSRTPFRRYRGRRVPFQCFARQESFLAVPRASVPFSCFVLPDSFSAVPSASGLVFMFCALKIVFGGTESVESRFHVLRSRTHFRRYRGRRIPFSCFVRPDSFSAVPSASDPVFMFCAPELRSPHNTHDGACDLLHPVKSKSG